MARIRISVVEDHPVLRDVLREFLERQPGVELGRVWADAEAALAEFDDTVPELMLIDLSLPRMSGIELIQALRRRVPGLRCAILSGHRSPVYVRQAMAVGADGYLLKGDPVEIERGIEAIVAGKTYISPELAGDPHGSGPVGLSARTAPPAAAARRDP